MFVFMHEQAWNPKTTAKHHSQFSDTVGQLETVEMETGNGKWKWSKLQMNAGVKPLINNHLLKATSVQLPPL